MTFLRKARDEFCRLRRVWHFVFNGLVDVTVTNNLPGYSNMFAAVAAVLMSNRVTQSTCDLHVHSSAPTYCTCGHYSLGKDNNTTTQQQVLTTIIEAQSHLEYYT